VVTGVGKTRATSIAGPAAGALPNAQRSVCSGFPGCWPVSCVAAGAAKAARQIVSENPSPLAGMKPTGISARNTRVTSRMLITSSRLRRLNRVERMSGGLVPWCEDFILSEMHPRFPGTLRQHTGIPDRWVS
jgi:hypothetical protein